MELKERIINQATRMFFESGIKSVRMDDIAAACGISKRTLYENFSDREDIIRKSIEYHYKNNENIVKERLDKAENAIDEFWMLFDLGSDFRDSNRRIVQDLLKFYPAIFNDFMVDHQNRVVAINRERIERGIEEGVIIKEIDSTLMSKLLSSYLYGVKKDFEEHDFSDSSDTTKDYGPFQYAIILFLRGIATEKGRSYIDEKILARTGMKVEQDNEQQ